MTTDPITTDPMAPIVGHAQVTVRITLAKPIRKNTSSGGSMTYQTVFGVFTRRFEIERSHDDGVLVAEIVSGATRKAIRRLADGALWCSLGQKSSLQVAVNRILGPQTVSGMYGSAPDVTLKGDADEILTSLHAYEPDMAHIEAEFDKIDDRIRNSVRWIAGKFAVRCGEPFYAIEKSTYGRAPDVTVTFLEDENAAIRDQNRLYYRWNELDTLMAAHKNATPKSRIVGHATEFLVMDPQFLRLTELIRVETLDIIKKESKRLKGQSIERRTDLLCGLIQDIARLAPALIADSAHEKATLLRALRGALS